MECNKLHFWRILCLSLGQGKSTTKVLNFIWKVYSDWKFRPVKSDDFDQHDKYWSVKPYKSADGELVQLIRTEACRLAEYEELLMSL